MSAAISAAKRADEPFFADLERRRLTQAQVEAAGMWFETNARDLSREFPPVQAICIPYFTPDGQEMECANDSDLLFCRVRLLEEPPKGFVQKKAPKYLQARGSGVHAYFPKGTEIDWPVVLSDPQQPLLITEGEFKSLTACLHGFATVGLGGVYNFTKDGALLPELQAIAWQGRFVYIIYDSDLSTKADVQVAEWRLCSELLNRGAIVHAARLPIPASGGKVGVDDFLQEHGPDALRELLKNAQPAEIDRLCLLDNNKEPENLEKMDAVFAASDLPHYQRLGRRVHITRNANTDEERPGALVIRECTRRVIQQDAQRIITFQKFDARRSGGGAYVPAQCPDRLAEMYLCKSNGWSVPELRGVRESPTLRADGSILQTPGYDRATGYLYAPQLEYPTIPENPSRADAEVAFDMLAHVVRDFDFASNADASVWLAAVLTDAVRPALEAAPVFGFDAPQFGAGKSLLANLVCLIVHGTKLIGKGWTADEAENEKRLYAALLAGEHSYLADNIKKGLPFGGEAIAAILTQDQWAARKLGKSEQTPVSTRTMFYATGVNLTFTADLVRRALKCRIEPQVEHPENRPFSYDVAADTLANHARLLTAALTIIRAYTVAGLPMQGKFKPMGSFGEFDMLVRGAQLWLGLADPLETQRDIESIDPEIDALARGLELLEAVFGGRAFQVKEIAALAGKVKSDTENSLLDWVRENMTPPRDGSIVNTKALGHYFKEKRGTPRDGRRLVIVDAGTAEANGKLGRDGTIWRVGQEPL
ncbi:MAG: DUF3854 domain-containing protein [Rhizomicrobium sp.]